MKRVQALAVLCMIILKTNSFASSLYFLKTDTVLLEDTVFNFSSDDPFFARQDSILEKHLKETLQQIDTMTINIFKYSKDSIPIFTDSVYKERLEQLNAQTPFNLHYNRSVQTQINLYANNYRKHIGQMLGKAEYYFPLFEEKLEGHNLPLEFKYLAVVESALKPNARSRSAATGLWQFMYNTGKIYDLKVTSYIDDRSDPIKSTIAACEYFLFLYEMFEDWSLVLAAYNGGPGYVSRAMRRTGAKDYWSVRPFLRRETQNYVPKFIAINYIMSYASEHNIYPIKYLYNQAETDTISISQSMKFETLAEILDMSKETLQELNPTYKKDIIPVGKNEKRIIRLPRKRIADFINNQEMIYAISLEEQKPYIEADESIIHYVKNGEYLGKIAREYNTSTKQLMSWNSLKNSRLRIGQKLVVYINNDKSKKQEEVTKTTRLVEYVVRSGDTLWGIAQKHKNVSVSQLKKINKLGSQSLKPGLKIKIPAG